MTVPERVAALRALMKAYGIDAYLIPTDDYHGSEYVGDHFKCREWISGFTGSAGTVLVTEDFAGLWTDGRYFLQAASQLEGSGIELMKMGEEGVPTIHAFLRDHLTAGSRLGFDGRTVTSAYVRSLWKVLMPVGAEIVWHLNLIGELWKDRPALSKAPVWDLSTVYAGVDRSEKIELIRSEMKKRGADYFLLTSLDDIAWLLNIRGGDVDCCPVVLSYLLLSKSHVRLFTQADAFPDDLQRSLEEAGVDLMPYREIYEYVKALPATRSIYFDPSSVNYCLEANLPPQMKTIRGQNLTLLPKACKNPVETANIRRAHIKDGAAVTRFIYWLKKAAASSETITELSAAEKLEEFRREGEDYQGPSFHPIIAYGAHAAIVHYSATKETDIPIEPKGMLLADTGGHYLDGSTDITRTIVLGEITQKEREFYTRVLKGHLNLGNAVFLKGCSGLTLDYLAREPLWEIGEDYNHGTGHGVGYLLNVHEGPNDIRWRKRPGGRDIAPFEEGMVTSDEPGIYFEGEFGVRLENLMVCVKKEMKPCGQFMGFDMLTMVPFDLEAVDVTLLTEKEKERLNRYHAKVWEEISPLLSGEEKEWLREATRKI